MNGILPGGRGRNEAPSLPSKYSAILRRRSRQAAQRSGYFCMYSLELNGELLAAAFGLAYRGRYYSPKIALQREVSAICSRPSHRERNPGMIAHREESPNTTSPASTMMEDEVDVGNSGQIRVLIFRQGLPGNLAHAIRFPYKTAVKKLVRR